MSYLRWATAKGFVESLIVEMALRFCKSDLGGRGSSPAVREGVLIAVEANCALPKGRATA